MHPPAHPSLSLVFRKGNPGGLAGYCCYAQEFELCAQNTYMWPWHLGTWRSGHGAVGFLVELNHLTGLLHPKQFNGSVFFAVAVAQGFLPGDLACPKAPIL